MYANCKDQDLIIMVPSQFSLQVLQETEVADEVVMVL